MNRYGIILVDGTEVVIWIYEQQKFHWNIIYHQTRDLIPLSKQPLESTEIIEAITQALLSGYSYKIDDWKIIARNLSDITTREISLALGLKVSNLTLIHEQELLSKGALMELL